MDGIRKARFASFVLLLVCFAAMLVINILVTDKTYAWIASACVIAALLVFWWFYYRSILFKEAAFFNAFASDMRTVYHRLRMLESVVRQNDDGVVIVAKNGDLILVNAAARRLLAALDDDLEGSRYDEYAADFNENLKRAAILESARKGVAPLTVGVEGQYYKIGYVVLTSEKGDEQGAVATISDVTESAKAERMQLDFVANVSHELNTPLTSVRSYAETLLDDHSDEDMVNDFLSTIVSEAARMGGLIKELRIVSETDRKEIQLNITDNDLPTLVKTSMKVFDKDIKDKALSVYRMFPDNLRLNVELDRDRIEQVLINLFGNAIKYTEEKGRIDVDIISGQNSVQIVIKDNGIGIPEEALSRVFERFYRVDSAHSRKTGGSGLGLAISKQIVDAHGGTMALESSLGRGTTVTVSLPLGPGRGTPGID